MPNRIGGYGQALPDQSYLEREKQMAEAIMPFITRLISGEHIEGITPRAAQRLMGIVDPQAIVSAYDRGLDVDPTWYSNYIQPGRVSPQTYSQIMDYSRGFMGMQPELAERGFASQWGETPMYSYSGGAPTYQQQLMDDAINRQRLAMEGLTFDPYTQRFRYTPGAEEEIASRAAANLGLESEISGEDAPGIISRIIRGLEPVFEPVSFVYNPGAHDAQDIGYLDRIRLNNEAAALGLTADDYLPLEREIRQLMNEGKIDQFNIVPILAQYGLNPAKLETANPQWWQELKKRPRVRALTPGR